MLGKTLSDFNGNKYDMAGLLPFHAKKGSLKVGYRNLKSTVDSLILGKNDDLIGHEFHRWELSIEHSYRNSIENSDSLNKKKEVNSLWEVKGWRINNHKEGWGNKIFHASWMHLHWPSSPKIMSTWLKALETINLPEV